MHGNLVLTLHGHTARVNQLLGNWRRAAALKKRDIRLVRGAAVLAIGPAYPTRPFKQRVDLTVILGPRQHADKDCWWKSILDALVGCGLLRNDSDEWLELGTVTHLRGPRPMMRVYLTPVEEDE